MYIPVESLPGLQPIEVVHLVRPGRPALSNEERSFRRKLGAHIRQVRRQKDKTQLDVALAVGIKSPAAICALETGKWYNKEVIGQVVRFLLSC